ncbi:hypothetical protein PENTCL1PPCAC_22180, partial [Pristionchus entomophagus]
LDEAMPKVVVNEIIHGTDAGEGESSVRVSGPPLGMRKYSVANSVPTTVNQSKKRSAADRDERCIVQRWTTVCSFRAERAERERDEFAIRYAELLKEKYHLYKLGREESP